MPRLCTIERYLLVQLAALRRAIEQADQDAGRTGHATRSADGRPRWHIEWHRVPVDQQRRGTMHRADRWTLRGPENTAHQLAQTAEQHGGNVWPCDACNP